IRVHSARRLDTPETLPSRRAEWTRIFSCAGACPSPKPYPACIFNHLLRPVPTENPIQPSDACTYKNYPLILPIRIRNSVFLVLLPLYGSLPFSPSSCSLLFCASIGTDGGNPRPSPATGNPQPHS